MIYIVAILFDYNQKDKLNIAEMARQTHIPQNHPTFLALMQVLIILLWNIACLIQTSQSAQWMIYSFCMHLHLMQKLNCKANTFYKLPLHPH